MQPIFRSFRLMVPLAFFGYAVIANVTAVILHPSLPSLPTQLLSGGLTRDLDAAYKDDLPHMDISSSVIGAARYAVLGEARQGAVVGRNGWLFTSEEWRGAPTQADLATITGTIAQIDTDLAAHGTALVVVPLPAKVDIARAQAPDPRAADAQARLYADFTAQLAVRDVAVADARSALQQADSAVFFTTDTHWTPAGAAIVAQVVGDHPDAAKGDLTYQRTTTDQRLTGDLVSYVTNARLAPRIGLEAEILTVTTQVPNDVTQDIFGDSDTDIALVGTSYSANGDWGFADALMAALGRDVVNMAQQGLGPLQPMRDYLASADLRDAPPTLVIWEIPVRYLTDPALWPVDPAKVAVR